MNKHVHFTREPDSILFHCSECSHPYRTLQESHTRRHGGSVASSTTSSARFSASATLIGSASVASSMAEPLLARHTSSAPVSESGSVTVAASQYEPRPPLSAFGSYGTSSAPSDVGSSYTNGTNSSLQSHSGSSYQQSSHQHQNGRFYTAYGPSGEVQRRRASPMTPPVSDTGASSDRGSENSRHRLYTAYGPSGEVQRRRASPITPAVSDTGASSDRGSGNSGQQDNYRNIRSQ